MKTREQFVLLAEAYRKEAGWRDWLMRFSLITAFFLTFALAAILKHFVFHHIGGWIMIVLALPMVSIVGFYEDKSKKRLARKLDLFCPSCVRTFGLSDFKIVIATHNCPYCGHLVFS